MTTPPRIVALFRLDEARPRLVLPASGIEVEDGGFIYLTDSEPGRVSWPRGRFVIEYRAGYVLPDEDEPTLPLDISRAALLLVKQAYLGRDRDPFIRTEETYQVGSTTYGFGGLDKGHALPPEVEGLLSRYQISAGF